MIPLVEKEIFASDPAYLTIDYPTKGVTAYFSRNFDDSDHEILDKFLAEKKISILNTWSFKNADGSITLTIASVLKKQETFTFEGRVFHVIWGEFSFILEQVNDSLVKCLPYVANQNQKDMILKYIEHFNTGDIDAHKDS